MFDRMGKYASAWLMLFPFILLGCMSSCNKENQPSEQNVGHWPEETATSRPWSRWWWMGSAVDKENLNYLLGEYKKAGIGGLEIAPIYGAKGFENRFLDYLSPQWTEMLHYSIKKADSLGMEIDLTQGTGWPFGGKMVSPEMAAKKMLVQEYAYSASDGVDRPVLIEEDEIKGEVHYLHSLMAFQDGVKAQNITKYVKEDGSVDWDEKGKWKLIAIFETQTGQKVKRAAPGGEGYTLDHFSEKAVKQYLGYFDNALSGDFPDIRAFYNDSFEVYGADFTEDFFNFFESRRGYDLRNHLDQLNTEEGYRLKSDYRETISEMLLENFTKQWSIWAKGHGKQTKNQAHGSPGNLLDLYAAVSIPEGETFGSSYFPIPGIRRDSSDIRNVDPDPIMLKFASSAAHIKGNNLVSTETFTWLGEHFKSSFSQAKPELEQAFLAGVNHMFYHGITYSPKEVDFPGWLFYASLNLNTHNSLWPHLKGFNDYIQRVQSVLQAGKPDNELLVYWPVYDVWADPEGLGKTLTVHGIDDWLHPTPFYKAVKSLMDVGYGVDFISDELLKTLQVEGNSLTGPNEEFRSSAIVVPKTKFMPLATLKQLMDLSEQGAQVIFQEKPLDVPGFYKHGTRRQTLDSLWQQINFKPFASGEVADYGKGRLLLTDEISSALAFLDVSREKLTDIGLKFVRRKLGEGKYYYLVNHTAKEIKSFVGLQTQGKTAVLMDPEQGTIGRAKTKYEQGITEVAISLLPGQSIIVHVTNQEAENLPLWKYETTTPKVIVKESNWSLTFNSGGPVLPADVELATLKPWTAIEGEAYSDFSGQAVYESDFTLDKINGNAKYILSLGEVLESAKVWINEKEVGYAFSIPYRLDISGFVKKGENKVKVEVANLMANHVRYLDKNKIMWRNYHEINFVNIDYQPFDASGWKVMPSGLSGPVQIEIHD
ncbi:MAG: glycoside hydrolase [Cytophagales bacterium]|uniref:glycosyl hydrolase n=1 Tax=Cyclobacterium marinum TaxID=104 RepID=UPI0030D9CE5D|nr:glycoside hydrolase [Cytophagales bacterium]|tara:strand:- start:63476 stop:66280 length:2805 start_codon:yes stop_codon:yes gene_type:complete